MTVRLLVRERSKVLAYIWAILRDRHASEDVFQEVSILAIDRCAEIEGERHFLGWVRQAARFKALHAHAKRRVESPALQQELLDLLDGQWGEVDATSTSDLSQALGHCLDRLTPAARRLVELKYVDDLPGVRIAESLNRELRSVYTALSRIHRSLSECMRRVALEQRTAGD